MRSNVESKSSISSVECNSAGRTCSTSSESRYPRSLPTLMRWRTCSCISSVVSDKHFSPWLSGLVPLWALLHAVKLFADHENSTLKIRPLKVGLLHFIRYNLGAFGHTPL